MSDLFQRDREQQEAAERRLDRKRDMDDEGGIFMVAPFVSRVVCRAFGIVWDIDLLTNPYIWNMILDAFEAGDYIEIGLILTTFGIIDDLPEDAIDLMETALRTSGREVA
jgi:hypothetical protein